MHLRSQILKITVDDTWRETSILKQNERVLSETNIFERDHECQTTEHKIT